MSGRPVAVLGCIALGAYAALVTGLGGGVDDPNGGTCTAGSTVGCNPEAGILHIGGEKRCVVMQGEAYKESWERSPCNVKNAVEVTPGAAGAAAGPKVAACGVAGMDAVLGTIRTLESGGRYAIGPNAGYASGAYQFIRSTWDAVARRAGRADLVGTWPYQASPADQDALARQLVAEAMAGTDDVTRVPVVWYVGSIPPPLGWDVVPAPEAGNNKTPRQYQRMWMDLYHRAGTPCTAEV